ncbi:hypothetical protein ENTCAN_07796 [Enterobacter cancerogenus ATCC 35316]|nr:hypothetical protein ENTCAN_07796 [Enterobacter cancerogenus ATCC 35316]
MDNCVQPIQTAARQRPGFSHEAAAKKFYHPFLTRKRGVYPYGLARS